MLSSFIFRMEKTEMDQVTHNKIVSFIWGIADDVLRDLFKRGKYPDVILPMCVLRRPRKGTFAISGPNGSGKSGVIDAIEFGLTGQIGRLTGRGTKGLSVTEHGPHVDKTKFPDAAFVELRVFIPALGKSATITRKVSAPKKPKIVPAGDDIKAALAEIAEHPEVTLSRREI